MTKMAELVSNYPDPSVNIHAPELNTKAIKDSLESLLKLRFRYREYETAYDKELLDEMYEARVLGGASSTLKSIPGLVDNLARILELENESDKWEKNTISYIQTTEKNIRGFRGANSSNSICCEYYRAGCNILVERFRG